MVTAHLLPGADRYTALKVAHRRAYTVFRRNEAKRQPIEIKDKSSYRRWLEQAALEFLAEVGVVRAKDIW